MNREQFGSLYECTFECEKGHDNFHLICSNENTTGIYHCFLLHTMMQVATHITFSIKCNVTVSIHNHLFSYTEKTFGGVNTNSTNRTYISQQYKSSHCCKIITFENYRPEIEQRTIWEFVWMHIRMWERARQFSLNLFHLICSNENTTGIYRCFFVIHNDAKHITFSIKCNVTVSLLNYVLWKRNEFFPQ